MLSQRNEMSSERELSQEEHDFTTFFQHGVRRVMEDEKMNMSGDTSRSRT
jgi:hypothetical protein